MKVTPYLKILAEKEGLHFYLSNGTRPGGKFHGKLITSRGCYNKRCTSLFLPKQSKSTNA